MTYPLPQEPSVAVHAPPPPLLPAPQPYVVTLPQSGVPMTAQDVEAANVRLKQLRSELQDAAERRVSVANRLKTADPDARPGFQGRLQALDARIIGIENEITTTLSQLGSAPSGALIAGSSQVPDPADIFQTVANDLVPIVAILSMFVFAPIAIAISRLIWKRATGAPRVSAVTDQATQQKLDQLQQAVDTIAIEVERISEGQRFVTKIMNDRSIGAGVAEPVSGARKSTVPSERR